MTLAAILAICPGTATAQGGWASGLAPGDYVLDEARANLTARLHVFGAYHYTTRFRRLSGGFTYDPAWAAATQVTIKVDPRSMADPGSIIGRRMLASLEPERFPAIIFASRELRFMDSGAKLMGTLSMHGVTRPITLEMRFRGDASEGPAAGARTSFSGTGQVSRSDFGMTALHGLVGDQIDLVFDVDFIRR